MTTFRSSIDRPPYTHLFLVRHSQERHDFRPVYLQPPPIHTITVPLAHYTIHSSCSTVLPFRHKRKRRAEHLRDSETVHR
mmetsp:Transcript_19929/g.48399  ORF Transcript_19929/g.48399 Transcript_19929/m.48399 type:complete len:80 (+) Transcript_19929:110-349(+)